MSPFSIKFQANWSKLKIRPFFLTSEISLTYKFHYHHHVQDTQYTLNTNFQANRKNLKNRPFFSDGRNFAHTQILLSPSFSGYPIYPKYRISSQSDKVEISRIQWISCKNEKSQIFFISPIVLRIPYIPHIHIFKLIGQSWKFGRFFSDGRNFAHTQILLSLHFQDTRYTQNTKFQANRTRLKFRDFSEFRAKTKNRRIFLLVPLYSEYPIYPIY